jgi:lipopolysaccharide transport system ATP-binding protein
MSSNDIAIKAENIGKRYRIGLKEERNENLIGAFFDIFSKPVKNFRKYRSLYKFEHNEKSGENSSDIIWALQDVSFEVCRGEVVGIIGKNGAGKSTLLKILCKITDPSTGYAEMRGKVSSLLEVGTGFHPELTGRDNIYLNATILGMTKKEVDHKFDQIVDFSGVEKFIDTPVKRYSSGMAVRLAFSVAAHLEPENLIIDEVLAVGDVAFQKKCIGKMENMAGSGRTILFVSHNMTAITQLCKRTIWIDNGKVRMDGNTAEVVKAYLGTGADIRSRWERNGNVTNNKSNKEFEFRSIRLLENQKEIEPIIPFNSKLKLGIGFDILNPIKYLSITYHMLDCNGTVIYESISTDGATWNNHEWAPGSYSALCDVPQAFLLPGRYHVSVVAYIDGVKILDKHEAVLIFDVTEIGYNLNLGRLGFVTPDINWNIEKKANLLPTERT